MGTGTTDEFRTDAVRIALTSGLIRRQVSDDVGVGLLTSNKWLTAHRDTDVVSPEDRELAREDERLRRETRSLKEERDIHLISSATQFFTSQKPCGFGSSKNIVRPSRSTGCVKL